MKTQAEFDAAEQRWASQLRGRSLAMEADAAPGEARLALEIIGRTYRQYDERSRKAAVLRRYRAAYVVGVSSVAALYDDGGLWPHLARYFGELTQSDHQILSDGFRDALDSFGLARFHFPRRNIDEMLMHGGIPGPRTDEFLELLAQRSSLSDGLDGRQFCQWVGGLSYPAAFAHGLDVATWRFLKEGREVAEDVVDRALELLDRFASGPVSEADLVSFPAVMHADLLRGLDELDEKQLKVRRRRRDQVDLVPGFSFSPLEGLCVRLPSIEHVTDAAVEWTIAAEGSVRRVSVSAPWPGDAVQSHFVPVNRPVKQLALTAFPGSQTWTIDVVDPDDPLLVFDGRDGHWIPARNSLPKSEVWIALPSPDGLEFPDLVEVQGGDWSPSIVDAPLGWDGWIFARAEAGSISAFRLVGQDRWRYVTVNSRPQVDAGEPVAMVRTRDGGRVFSSTPTVYLPPTPQADGAYSTVEWTVSVTRSDGRSVAAAIFTVGSADMRIAVPTGAEGLVGEFDVQVRGPLGRGTSRRVVVVDGVRAEASTAFRSMLPAGTGLQPAAFVVEAPRCEQSTLRGELGSDAASSLIELKTGDTTLELEVEIPAMRVALLGEDRPLSSHSAVSVDIEDLTTSRLQVSIGTSGPTSLVALKRGDVLQSVTATATGPAGTAVFNLAQMTETLTQSGGATLVVSVGGERIRVAQVRRKQIIEAARLEGDSVVLQGLATDEPLEIAMYRRYAPWLPPVIVRTSTGDDRFDLPAALLGEAEVRLVVEIDDIWVERRWPREYPHRELNTVDIALGELSDARGGIDEGYRSWLRRTARCPSDPISLSFAVELHASAHLGKYRTPRRELQGELAEAISPFVEYLPAAYARAAVGRPPVDLFVESGGVLLEPGRYPHGSELWDASPLLAVLASGAALVSDPGVEGHIDRVLGTRASRVLKDGDDDDASVGRFGSNEELLARLPKDRVDAMWRSVNPVPARLLDGVTRQVAAKELFDQRAWIIVDFKEAEAALGAARRVLVDTYGPDGDLPIRARITKPGWTNLPAYSMAFSLVARTAARGHAAALQLHEVTRAKLLGITRMSPAFAEQDLVLAELWATRWSAE